MYYFESKEDALKIFEELKKVSIKHNNIVMLVDNSLDIRYIMLDFRRLLQDINLEVGLKTIKIKTNPRMTLKFISKQENNHGITRGFDLEAIIDISEIINRGV